MNDLPKNSAGRLANKEVPTCVENASVGAVLDTIKTRSATFESINYVYVLNDVKQLVGVVSLHELFSSSASALIGSIMVREVAYTHIRTDQEHVAQLALAQSIKAVPVIDDEMKFAGVISSDTILRILNEEHIDDLNKTVGLKIHSTDAYTKLSLPGRVRSRIPWLLLGLLGGILAAYIIELFDSHLEAKLIIASFIPAIVYLADAVGNQSEMLYVRSLGNDPQGSLLKYLSKEWIVATFVGGILSIGIYLLSYLWLEEVLVSLVLGLSIFATVYFSVTIAVVLPWLFQKFNFDPAVASGPLATVVCDLSSISIYLLIASTIL